MRLPVKARHIPGRFATGAFILHSGLTKRNVDDAHAEALYGMTKGAYPFMPDLDPQTFVKILSTGEIALGTALLLPVVPSCLAGAGLSAFSAGLLGLYARTPGMRQEGSVWPTERGTAMAKDVWMLGIGLGLLLDRG
jgi:hypothetical protein